MGITRKQAIMLAVLISGSFVTILNQMLINPAFPAIMAEMWVDASTVQWLTTGFTLVSAVMVPVSAYLIERFTTRKLFCVSMLIFCAGTLLAAWGPNFIVLLAGRLIQASGAGILMPLVNTALMLTFPVEKRGQAMGLFGIVIMFAPALGPTLAGFIVDHGGWHLMFYGVAALVLIDAIIGGIVLEKEEKAVPANLTLDKPSVILSTLGFGGMLYGFSVIGSTGLSVASVVAVIVGLAIVVVFFRRQLKLEVPMLEVRVLKSRKFLVGTIIGMIIQGSIMANGILIPIYVQTLCGQSATVSGIVMLPGSIIMGLMGPVSGRLFDRHGPRALAITGLAILVPGTIAMCMVNTSTPMAVLCCIFAVRNFGMSLVNMPLSTWAMNSLDNRLISHGNAVGNTFRQAAGSFGAAIVVSAYSLMADAKSSLGFVDAHMAAYSFAFWIQVALIVIALVMTIVLVKDKASDKILTLGHEPAAKVKVSNVSSLMQADVYAVPATATVAEAVSLLLEKGISSAPLVGENGEPCGFISDGDVIRALRGKSELLCDPVAAMLSEIHVEPDAKELIDEVMSSPVTSIARPSAITFDIDADLGEACGVLGRNHLKKAPVMANGKMVGIIARSDITRAALAEYAPSKQ